MKKRMWKTAEQKRKHQELESSWEKLQKKICCDVRGCLSKK